MLIRVKSLEDPFSSQLDQAIRKVKREIKPIISKTKSNLAMSITFMEVAIINFKMLESIRKMLSQMQKAKIQEMNIWTFTCW